VQSSTDFPIHLEEFSTYDRTLSGKSVDKQQQQQHILDWQVVTLCDGVY